MPLEGHAGRHGHHRQQGDQLTRDRLVDGHGEKENTRTIKTTASGATFPRPSKSGPASEAHLARASLISRGRLSFSRSNRQQHGQ